ncbi:MAG TPA: hypothetical protein VEJ63_22345 [Planctomycetota bacterium]|nr:hypothetical protein [Planctomycetota bacterium]
MRWCFTLLFTVAFLAGCGADAKKAELRAAEEAARKEAAAAQKAAPVATGEEKTPEPAPTPKDDTKKDEAAPSGETQKLAVGDRAVLVPAGWKKGEPLNRMRAAQFSIPKAGDDKDDGELVVFTLGGGLEANLKRWAGQMGGDKSQVNRRTVKTAGGDEATIVEYEGSYAPMNPMTGATEAPQEGYKMLGAYIIAGGKEYQFKLTGKAATVNAAKAGFERMVESFK